MIGVIKDKLKISIINHILLLVNMTDEIVSELLSNLETMRVQMD